MNHSSSFLAAPKANSGPLRRILLFVIQLFCLIFGLININAPVSAQSVTYNYDETTGTNGKGMLTSVSDDSGTTKFFYDQMGRVTRTDKTVDVTTYVSQTAYDNSNRIQSIGYPDGTFVSYAYNGPLLDHVYEGTITYVQYGQYNALGQPKIITYSNGVSTEYQYKPGNFRVHSAFTVKGTSCYQSMVYNYDLVGDIKEIHDYHTASNDTCSAVPVTDQVFDYDPLGRLTYAQGPYGLDSSPATLTYHYDEISNMLCNAERFPANSSSNCDPASSSYAGNYGYGNLAHKHGATSAAGTNYTYDANGNVVGRGTDVLTYDSRNNLISVSNVNGPTSFVYDGDGGRVKKMIGTATTVYIGRQYECKTTCSKYIFAGTQKIAVKPVGATGDIFFYHPDHLTSTNIVTNKIGAKVQEVAYYPYGKKRAMPGAVEEINVSHKYTSQELDESTELYFYGARYYDPVLARFISPDTQIPNFYNPQRLNRYAYADNNPLNYIDPTGHKSLRKRLKDAVKKNAIIGIIVQAVDPIAGTYLLSKSDQGRMVLQGEIIIGGIALGPAGAGVGALGMAAYGGATAAGMTALTGGSARDTLRSGAIGFGASFGSTVASIGVGSTSGFLIGQVAGDSVGAAAGHILGSAAGAYAAGAGSTLASGGSLNQANRRGLTGAAWGGGTASLDELYKAVSGFTKVDAKPGGDWVTKENGGAVEGANNVGNARTALQVINDISLGVCDEGSACSLNLNQVGVS